MDCEKLIRAADQGDADAQLKLGGMYHAGKGVPKNFVRAYMWFDIANSFEDMKDLAKKMSLDQNEKAKKLAMYWRQKANLKRVEK